MVGHVVVYDLNRFNPDNKPPRILAEAGSTKDSGFHGPSLMTGLLLGLGY